MKNAIRILRIQRTRLRRMIAETSDPELRHELEMLLSENFGARRHLRAQMVTSYRIEARGENPAEINQRVQQALGESKF